MWLQKDRKVELGCLNCSHFEDDAKSLEFIFRNLRIMCSAYASVRGDSGICNYDDRFRLPRLACDHYKPRE